MRRVPLAILIAACCLGHLARADTKPIYSEDFAAGPKGVLVPAGTECKAAVVAEKAKPEEKCLRLTGTGSDSEWIDWRSPRIALADTRVYELAFRYRGQTKSAFDVKYSCFDKHGQLIGYRSKTIQSIDRVPQDWAVFRRRIQANKDARSLMVSIRTFALDGTLDIAEITVTPVVQPPCVVSDMEMPWLWKPAFPETTVYGETQRVKEGQFSLAFKIKVDHKGGEKKYPIGWPHVSWRPDPPLDWSGFGKLSFWVYTESSRDRLPDKPLATICRQVRGHEVSSVVPGLEKNKWVKVTLPLPKQPLTEVRYVEFHICESDYDHGDEVTFTIDDMRLEK